MDSPVLTVAHTLIKYLKYGIESYSIDLYRQTFEAGVIILFLC